MNIKQILLGAVLVDFTGLTAWACYSADWSALGTTFSNPLVLQATADLVIAIGIVAVWMWRDAKRRGMNPLPYVALTCVTGSIGALVYLIGRAGDDETAPIGALETA